MTTRWQLAVAVLCTLLAAGPTHADIYRWDTGELIPGTEGIEPGPGVDLSGMELEFAQLAGVNLTNANLSYSTLSNADFTGGSDGS